MYLQNELIANQRKKEIEEMARNAWKQKQNRQSNRPRFLQILLALFNV